MLFGTSRNINGLKEMELVKNRQQFRKPIIIWLLLNIADWFTTVIYGQEDMNPIISKMTPLGLLFYKLLLPLIVIGFLAVVHKLKLLKVINILFGLVVIWNISQIVWLWI